MEDKQRQPPASGDNASQFAPAVEQEKPERFNNLVTILILLATVWTACLAYIQSYDGDRQGDAARDSQVASVNALTAYSSAIQQNSADAKLLARYDELTLQANASTTAAGNYSEAGDVFSAGQSRAAAERLLKARESVRSFSPAFTDTRLLDEDKRPDLSIRIAEAFEPAYRYEETQIVLSQQSSAVMIKTDAYVLMITLAAVALFLFGLSLTVDTTFVRALFVGLGSLLVAGSIGWFFVVRAAPEPSLTDEAVASFAHGRVAADKGNLDEAIQYFGDAIARSGNPVGYSRAYLQRGDAYSAKKDLVAAIADYSKAIELAPNADAYSARGTAYIDTKEYARAMADLKRAVELSPESDDDWNNLGWAQYLAGQYPDALASFGKCIALSEKYPLYYFNLGVTMLASGSRSDAKSAYEKGFSLTENKPVELVGWQLEGAIEDLEALPQAPGVSMTGELSQTVQDLLTRARTGLAETSGRIDGITFSSGVQDDQPADKLTVFEPGTQQLYAFINFSGFVDGAVWHDTWYVNGALAPEISTERAVWDAGDAGSTYFILSTDDEGLTPGEYKVEVRVGDRLIQTASFRVRPTRAAFGSLTFAQDVDAKDQPVNPGMTFQKGIKEVKALFEFTDMVDNLKWSALWWQDGQEIDTSMASAPTWTYGADGVTYVSLSNDEELPVGEYNLVLLVEGDVFQEGTFKIVEPSDLFGPIAFANEVDQDNRPVAPAESLPSDTGAVYATFDYQGMQDGQAWSAAWYLDGSEVSRSQATWRGGASGHTWVLLSDKDGLAPGQYDLELSVEGKIVQLGSVTVEQ